MDSTQELSLETTTEDGVATVTVRGDVDMTSAPELRSVLEGMEGVDRVVVDLRTVTFIDSTGLGALIAARKALFERDIAIALVADSGPAGRLLALTRLDETFGTFETVEDALQG